MQKETTLKKQFSERDLQRIRNLATKKIHDKTITSIGYTKQEELRVDGDVWEENGRTWTIKNGIKRNIRKVDSVSVPLLCPKCSRPMKHRLDKQMYSIHQMCLHCTTEMESELKMQGKYEEYEQNMIKQNAQYYAKNVSNGLDQFLDDIINESYVTEDGTIQNWVGNGLDKSEIKQKILDKMQKIQNATKS
jgi:hypothetical protein